MNETDTQVRLRRAKDTLNTAREHEITARKALNDAMEATRRIKERYEELFLQNENEERARTMATYLHTTK